MTWGAVWIDLLVDEIHHRGHIFDARDNAAFLFSKARGDVSAIIVLPARRSSQPHVTEQQSRSAIQELCFPSHPAF